MFTLTSDALGARTPRLAFLNTTMNEVVRPPGWQNWNQPEREKTTRSRQFGSTGPGAKPAERVAWAHSITARGGQRSSLPRKSSPGQTSGILRSPAALERIERKLRALHAGRDTSTTEPREFSARARRELREFSSVTLPHHAYPLAFHPAHTRCNCLCVRPRASGEGHPRIPFRRSRSPAARPGDTGLGHRESWRKSYGQDRPAVEDDHRCARWTLERETRRVAPRAVPTPSRYRAKTRSRCRIFL